MRSSRISIVLPAALGAILGFVAGCTDTNRPIVPVEGKLTLSNGKPLPAGTKLMFNPAEGRTGTATATTEADGSFKLTHVSGSSGAELGKYSVQLTPPQGSEKEFYQLVSREKAEGALFAEIKEGMGPLTLTLPKGR